LTDISVDVAFITKYVVNAEYTQVVLIGAGIAGALLLLLIVMVYLYKKHKKLYSQAADERMRSLLATQESEE
jgi:TRAP-type uncharacterized transport system fused permease subunit